MAESDNSQARPEYHRSAIDRVAIDSRATRLGAIAVVQLAAQNSAGTPFHQALLHIVLVALVGVTVAAIVPAIRDAMGGSIAVLNPRSWLEPAVLVAAAVIPLALAFPVIAPLVDWLLSDRIKLWIFLAAILFCLGVLAKLAVCRASQSMWKAVRRARQHFSG